MKVALCISGQMRTFKSCFNSIDKFILRPFSPDIFISTWDQIGGSEVQSKRDGKNFKNNKNSISKDMLCDFYKTENVCVESFIESEILKKASVDAMPKEFMLKYPPDDWMTNVKKNERVGRAKRKKSELWEIDCMASKTTLPLFYKIWHCNEMKCNYEAKYNIKYDIVIRLRPDLMLTYLGPPFVEKEEAVKSCSDGTLWHSPIRCNPWPNGSHISDKFLISNSDTMNIYSSCFLDIKKYWKTPYGEKWSDSMIGERLSRHHCLDKKLKLKILSSKGILVR